MNRITSKIKYLQFLVGKAPIFVLFVLFLNKDKLTSPLLTYSVLGIFVVVNLWMNYYFSHKLKLEKYDSSSTSNQMMFMLVSSVFGLIGMYKFFTAVEMYQKILSFICLVISFVLLGLLIWGLKYCKPKD